MKCVRPEASMIRRLVPRTGPLLVLLILAFASPANSAQMDLDRLEMCDLRDNE